MKYSEVDKKLVSPMMKQYLEIKEKNDDKIILFRLGDFYEMFFEDAIIVSHALELTLTGKNAGLDERIPMCGVPHHAASIYIEKLVELGHKVAICEQLENAKDVKGIVKRGITQVVTKGMMMSESLDEKESNYTVAIIDLNHAYGISFVDVSTGEMQVFLLEHNNTKLVSEIISLGVKEIVVKSNFDKTIISLLTKQFKIIVTYFDENYVIDEYKYISENINDERLISVLNFLLSYIDSTQKRKLSHLQKAIIRDNNQYLKMNIHTKRNLELTETLRLKERNMSLIWLLDKTKTAMGSRLLKTYIESPLVSKNEINKRYDMVETLLNEFILKDDLQNLLFEVYDLERLGGRIAFGNANARDLLHLKSSLAVLPEIYEILDKLKFGIKTIDFSYIYDLLEKGIYENPPITINEGYLIKEGYNEELDELKSLRKGGKDFIAKFEAEERAKTGIKNLKVGYNRVFGYYIEVSKGSVNLVKDEFGYDRRQTLSNCERYISSILKEKEALILNAEEKIVSLEYKLFNDIKNVVMTYIPKLQEISKIISEIDVLQSFATISEENNYIRPTLLDKHVVEIKDARHPVVEKVIGSEIFVENDIIMDENTNLLLITGPNMAGKSTYMRQFAIIVIMAQMGCFIPCQSAKMPIFDAIFTRIGASDDLVSGESTFMVEMNEANYAISSASINSLILFDELGRGTATFDGMALAQSIIEYISVNIKAKTLFSTHYHELTDLENNLTGVKNIHVSAYEENGNITFLHKVKTGSVDKSYGIHVAKLANLPDELIKRANQILTVYENKETKRDIIVQEAFILEDIKESKIEKALSEIDPLTITPLEALNILSKLKNEM